MAPSNNTRSAARKPDEQARDDLVANNIKMYPVVCTADIPPEILDEFIEAAYNGCFRLAASGDVKASPCILQTNDLNAVEHGSRTPMPAFESPFLGQTVDEIRVWMREHRHPLFAYFTFTILDEDTIKNKTCKIAYCGPSEDDRVLLADFYTNMVIQVPIEVGVRIFDEEELAGTDKVYDRKHLEEIYRLGRERFGSPNKEN